MITVEERNRIVAENMGLVHMVANEYHKKSLHGVPWVDREDLIQQGSLGLIRAVETFREADGGASFSTWACIWIRCFLRRMDKSGSVIDLPNRVRSILGRICGEMNKGKDLETVFQEIKLKYPRARYSKEVLSNLLSTFVESLDEEIGNGKGVTGSVGSIQRHEVVSDPNAINPENYIEAKSVLKEIVRLNKVFCKRKRDKTILLDRFGIIEDEQGVSLNPRGPQTLQEIGNRLHLTRERIRQIENGLLEKISEKIGEEITIPEVREHVGKWSKRRNRNATNRRDKNTGRSA